MLSRVALRPAHQALRAAAARSTTSAFRSIHGSSSSKASASPFTEPTSPNPSLTLYAKATEELHTYGSYLMQCLPKFIQQFSVLNDELTLYIPPSGVIPVLTFLRDHSQCQFKSVMDISGVDFPEREKRFEVVYHLLSVKYRGRIRVKTYAGEGDHVPSAIEVFKGADWYEREAWDLFGIFFSGHPDLRRILTDYGLHIPHLYLGFTEQYL
ncbi:putative NADH-ubiquinone oxidoreductase 30.4 kDa subunit, mitochondrial [Stygiomarasmius scandens]|uniref:NADH-ubiquinone oxidoreductase 30.4 kDa subunit, mitochondrial n=1 Tax=Marasmiellus scandens TaxID=2682957 RepID=A0ABR1JR81_9AGAR